MELFDRPRPNRINVTNSPIETQPQSSNDSDNIDKIDALINSMLDKISYFDFFLTKDQELELTSLKRAFLKDSLTDRLIRKTNPRRVYVKLDHTISCIVLAIFTMEMRRHDLYVALASMNIGPCLEISSVLIKFSFYEHLSNSETGRANELLRNVPYQNTNSLIRIPISNTESLTVLAYVMHALQNSHCNFRLVVINQFSLQISETYLLLEHKNSEFGSGSKL